MPCSISNSHAPHSLVGKPQAPFGLARKERSFNRCTYQCILLSVRDGGTREGLIKCGFSQLAVVSTSPGQRASVFHALPGLLLSTSALSAKIRSVALI